MKKQREVKIYCPKCRWEPEQSSRWQCTCLCTWNTFDTGGVCPDCGKAWETTQCLSLPCHRHSPHRDWYHEFITETQEVVREETAPAQADSGL